jgi:hypothetical protein
MPASFVPTSVDFAMLLLHVVFLNASPSFAVPASFIVPTSSHLVHLLSFQIKEKFAKQKSSKHHVLHG